MLNWLQFILSAGLIVAAGVRLTRYADHLSEHLRLDKTWIGIVILGIVTSLPEAVTSFYSVAVLNANNLAIGNLLGSNIFNPMLIVVMDFFYRKGSVTDAIKPSPSHTTAAMYAMGLAIIVIAEITQADAGPIPHFGPISMGGFLIAFIYFYGMKQLAAQGSENYQVPHDYSEQKAISINKIWINIGVSALVVILSAIWIATVSDKLAYQSRLGSTFFGSFFLALATSLPEMVVTISALRLGSLDLAIGNIFGSNMTNIFIIFLCSFGNMAYPIIGLARETHKFTALLGIALSYLVIRGINNKGKGTFFGIGYDSVILIVAFIIGTVFIYNFR